MLKDIRITKKKINLLEHVYIAGIGVYIPPYRITVEEIAKAWNQNGAHISQSLGVTQKSVAGSDEDSVTMAMAAASQAIAQAKIDPKTIGAVFVGSESHPYAVKPTGTIVGEWLGLSPHYFCADLQFACKAGTAGMQIVAAMLEAGFIEAGLVIGVDKAQGKPGDALEYTAASAAVAFVLTRKQGLAQLRATYSYSSDTPDFWRRQTKAFPEHAGRFTGEPAYFRHIESATQVFLSRLHKTVADFNHIVFHMPNGKFPARVAAKLGVSQDQLTTGFTVKAIGNPYSASSMLGLARVLTHRKKGDEILVTSYGSGSGSDSFWITARKSRTQAEKDMLEKQLTDRIPLSYIAYMRQMGILDTFAY